MRRFLGNEPSDLTAGPRRCRSLVLSSSVERYDRSGVTQQSTAYSSSGGHSTSSTLSSAVFRRM